MSSSTSARLRNKLSLIEVGYSDRGADGLGVFARGRISAGQQIAVVGIAEGLSGPMCAQYTTIAGQLRRLDRNAFQLGLQGTIPCTVKGTSSRVGQYVNDVFPWPWANRPNNLDKDQWPGLKAWAVARTAYLDKADGELINVEVSAEGAIVATRDIKPGEELLYRYGVMAQTAQHYGWRTAQLLDSAFDLRAASDEGNKRQKQGGGLDAPGQVIDVENGRRWLATHLMSGIVTRDMSSESIQKAPERNETIRKYCDTCEKMVRAVNDEGAWIMDVEAMLAQLSSIGGVLQQYPKMTLARQNELLRVLVEGGHRQVCDVSQTIIQFYKIG